MEILGLSFDATAEGAPFTHDRALVILSFVVAATASYTALDLAERLRTAGPRSRPGWLLASAITLGGGIWAMHFIGMLGFETPLERGYDIGLTALSAFVAVAVVAIGLALVNSGRNWMRLAIAGVIVGLGIVAMHYTGMAALRVAGKIYYHPDMFAASVAIALAAAVVALWLAFALENWWQRAAASLVMGVAICGMHYTGMAATAIVAGADIARSDMMLSEAMLAGVITLGVFAIVLMGLAGAFLDRRLEAESRRETTRLRALNATLERRVDERTAQLSEAAENLKIAFRRAERASQAKSDFLASMSHELRTPLNAILGFSQLLLQGRATSSLSNEQAGMIEQIERAGRHLLNLIEEILDLSRIEAGKISLSIETVDAVEVVEDVVASFQAMALDAGVTIHISAPARKLAVKADRTRLRQILTNLISNGVKYNHRGGEVDIAFREADGRIYFFVTDTGAGIPQNMMEELFEPFNRLGQEQSTTIGAGIGLSLCKRLVTAQGGQIWAESKQGAGSTFIVGLPSALPTPRAGDPNAKDFADDRARILYIEDNPSNVLLMRHIMKEFEEVELIVATTPEDGINLAGRAKPAAILMDINLPGMDGYEVLRILKSNPALARIPVIALSANAMPDQVNKGLKAGFHRYLTKPIDLAAFATALNEVLPPSPRPKRAAANA